MQRGFYNDPNGKPDIFGFAIVLWLVIITIVTFIYILFGLGNGTAS